MESPATLRNFSVYLVDGHHVFLETIKQVRYFCELIDDGDVLKSLALTSNKHLSETGIGKVYLEALEAADYADIAIHELLKLGLGAGEWGSRIELNWFDAEMKPIHELQYYCNKELGRISSKPEWFNRKSNIQRILDLLKLDMFEFFADDELVRVPYSLKNKFIEEISNPRTQKFQAGDAFQHWGWRDFRINYKGLLSGGEKGVDTQLTMRACDLANDTEVSGVCFVTNDSDYVPVVERLEQRRKDVSVYTLSQRPSNALKDSVGVNSFDSLSAIQARMTPANRIREVMGDDFVRRISNCPIFWSMKTRMEADIKSLIAKGMTSNRAIRKEAEETVTKSMQIQ